jgi:trimeric autotransporter adhesin
VNNACFIGQIFEATSANGTAVFINSSGRLGTMTSSRRFKQEIKPMGDASEALLALKPVTFRYKKEIDPAGTSQFGLVAEEVEIVDPALVIRDKDGKPYSVRYDQVNAMLLNEFLKEHGKVGEQDRRIVEQEATITRLAKQIETVVARLQGYDSKIQRVSDQVQMNSVERRTVASKQ